MISTEARVMEFIANRLDDITTNMVQSDPIYQKLHDEYMKASAALADKLPGKEHNDMLIACNDALTLAEDHKLDVVYQNAFHDGIKYCMRFMK